MLSIDSSANSVAEIRAAIRRHFESWLDGALAEEPLPSGLAPELLAAIGREEPLPPLEGHADLYTLWAALTAMTQEVKLQSRAFQQVNDTLARLPETIIDRMRQESSFPLGQFEQEEEPQAELASPGASEQYPQKPHIDLLLDLRDRFERGLNSVHQASAALVAPAGCRWSRWFGREPEGGRQAQQVLDALENGYSLTLERLDQCLRDYQVNPMLCQGQQFDAHSMTAIEVEQTDVVPEGTVVEVYRAGYEWEGKPYRPAQVKVARRKLSASEG
jgi:molecular chaperone GrpE